MHIKIICGLYNIYLCILANHDSFTKANYIFVFLYMTVLSLFLWIGSGFRSFGQIHGHFVICFLSLLEYILLHPCLRVSLVFALFLLLHKTNMIQGRRKKCNSFMFYRHKGITKQFIMVMLAETGNQHQTWNMIVPVPHPFHTATATQKHNSITRAACQKSRLYRLSLSVSAQNLLVSFFYPSIQFPE